MESAVTGRARGCVFLLTDYGISDEFAGILRAVIARDAPDAPVVDLTHGVAPFDVRAGALALVRSAPHLGPGVVVGVVDPGVGSARRAVAIEAATTSGPRHLVGPDNGLLVWAAEALGGIVEAVELESRGAGTFDGRDVFAPAAAALWRGTDLSDLGVVVDAAGLVRLSDPVLSVSRGTVETEVLRVDRFGNAQLSATASDADDAHLGRHVEVDGGSGPRRVGRAGSFSDVPSGGIGIMTDSNGHLALVGDRSSAARTLGLSEGDPVTLRSVEEPS
jgi:S-adenosyl-L-methionine hydrolase (adenosine-forming)